jgi:hypothetical protein
VAVIDDVSASLLREEIFSVAGLPYLIVYREVQL